MYNRGKDLQPRAAGGSIPVGRQEDRLHRRQEDFQPGRAPQSVWYHGHPIPLFHLWA